MLFEEIIGEGFGDVEEGANFVDDKIGKVGGGRDINSAIIDEKIKVGGGVFLTGGFLADIMGGDHGFYCSEEEVNFVWGFNEVVY